MKVSIAPDFEHLLPALSDAESAQLEANCKADPSHERMPPVVIWSNQKNTIIDGHNQHRIRERLRLKVKFAKLEFETRDEAYQYALDVQFGRRNLSASQRAMAYAKLPHKPVGKPTPNVAKLPHIEKLAEKASVSKRTMVDAVQVADNAPAKVIKAVEAGEVSVSAAAKETRGPSFDTKKIDSQPARKETKPRAGKPTVSTEQRKECLALHAKLCRALQAIGIYDEFISHLSQISERLKKI